MTEISVPVTIEPKERILFEARPSLLPAILTFENLTLIGIVVLAVLFSVVFRIGPLEIAVIAILYVLLAFPSFRTIFLAGSTTYVLTNRRLVIFTFGFKQNEQSVPLGEVDSAKCKFSGLQRFYGAGDVIVNRKGLRKPIRLRSLPQCKNHAEQLNKAVESYKKSTR